MKTIENPYETVSAFDAKTHLSELLRKVEEGHEIYITKRGKLVAKLVPYVGDKKALSKKELLEQFDEIRKKVKGKVNTKSYIAEGRKY